MPLFQRFFAIAVLVLVFHSVLTGILVSERVRDRERELAVASLDDSSQLVYENFNNWKRALWGQLVELSDDTTTEAIVESLSPRRTVDWVVRTIDGAGPGGADTNEVTVRSVTGLPSPPALGEIETQPMRPHITGESRAGTTYLRASRPFSTQDGRDGAIHLVKLLDETFCRRLAIDSQAAATFITSVGQPPGVPALRNAESFESAMSPRLGYERLLGMKGSGDGRFNGSLRNAGTLQTEQGSVSMYLAVMLDTGRGEERLNAMAHTLVLASLLSIGLSAGLVLLGSWRVTKPIVRLTQAMERVAAGDFSVRLMDSSNRESSTLIEGFNRMSRQLEQDVSEREKHIEEITALTAANETIFQSIGTAMITVDSDLRIQRVNRAGAELLRGEESTVRGMNLEAVQAHDLGPYLVSVATSVYNGEGPIRGELRRTTSRVYELGGVGLRTGPSTEAAAPESCLLIVEDVTEKVSLEEQMVRAEKLSSLAILTAGVAHEINNPLSSITTNVQNIADEIEDPEQKRAVEYIQHETRRIRDIVGRLNDFAGKTDSGQPWADLKDEVELVLSTVQYSFPPGEGVSLQTDLDRKLPPTSIPAAELRQILLNLVTNALQAVDSNNGTVRVTTGTEDGHTLWLEVEDDGEGISDEVQQRIFDPFFTTKQNGSGLGLSVVYGLLNRYGGSCLIRSSQGTGTTVHLDMPSREDFVDDQR